MQARSGRRGTALLILNLGARWGLVNATPRPLDLRERASVPTVHEAGWASGFGVDGSAQKKNLLTPPGFAPPNSPARNITQSRPQYSQ